MDLLTPYSYTGNKEVYDDVIRWKFFRRYWPFVRGIHRSPVNSPHKGRWRGALVVSLIWTWTNNWANNREAGDFRRHRAHYDDALMWHGDGMKMISAILILFDGNPRPTVEFITRSDRDKMAAIYQTTFWNGLSWMKMYKMWSLLHYRLFLRSELTI